MRTLQHPDITKAEKYGYPKERKKKKAYCCAVCGEEIYEGESYYWFHEKSYCVACIHDSLQIA